jgi:hypothetical protein
LTRDDHTALNFQDLFMLIFGGFVDGGERTNELWKFFFATNTWELV